MTNAPSSSAALTVFSHSVCHAGRESAALEICIDDTEIQNASELTNVGHFPAVFSTGAPFLSGYSLLALRSGRCKLCMQYMPSYSPSRKRMDRHLPCTLSHTSRLLAEQTIHE